MFDIVALLEGSEGHSFQVIGLFLIIALMGADDCFKDDTGDTDEMETDGEPEEIAMCVCEDATLTISSDCTCQVDFDEWACSYFLEFVGASPDTTLAEGDSVGTDVCEGCTVRYDCG